MSAADPYNLSIPAELVDVIAAKVAGILEGRQPAAAPKRWLTIDEAADYIGAKPKRIYDLRSAGRLSRTGDGSRVLVDRNELDRLIGG
jgi:excisionase family DNA binding protein